MSQAGSERGDGDIASVEDLTDLVGVLRAELQSIRERELRREGRLVTFDQQVAQMEASLEEEVERLRSTGSAVDLITEHLRIAVRELLAERQELSETLAELGGRLEHLSPPDLQPITDRLHQLGEELRRPPAIDLQPIHDRIDALSRDLAATPTVDLAPLEAQVAAISEQVAATPTVDLQPLHDRIDTLRQALASAPDVDLAPLAAQLQQLNAQVDGLRTALSDRFDAIPQPDLAPLHAQLEELESRLGEQIGAVPAPDLSGLHDDLDRLATQVGALPGPDQVAAALAPRLDELAQATGSDAVIEAVEAAATRLAGQIGGLPDQVSVVSEVLSPLKQRLEGLAESDVAVRGDLALVTEVLAGLTQIAESGDEQLRSLTAAQRSLVEEQRSVIAEAHQELAQAVSSDVQQVTSGLAEVLARTASIDAVPQAIGETKDALSALTARIDRADEAGREAADAQALSLARVTAAADGLSTGLGSLRSAITTAGDTTATAVDERVAAHLASMATRLEADLHGLRQQLGDLGVSQLRVSVAELTQQVVEARADDRGLRDATDSLATQVAEGRADDRKLRDAVGAVRSQVAKLGAEGVAPVVAAIDELRARIDAQPAPDLGAVASQLARLSATIVSQNRAEPATSGHVDALGRSVEALVAPLAAQLATQTEATAAVRSQLDAQVAAHEQLTAEVRSLLAAEPSTPEPDAELARVSADLHAALQSIAEELEATRKAVERRGGSRWRRGGDEERSAATPPVPAQPAEPSEFERQVERALSSIDKRMGSLAAVAERAAAYADDAAKAASAALRVATAPPPAPPPAPSPGPSEPAPAKQAAPTRRTAPAKKAAGGSAAKRAAGGSAAKKAAAARKAPAKAIAAKKAGTAKKPAPRKKPAP